MFADNTELVLLIRPILYAVNLPSAQINSYMYENAIEKSYFQILMV